MKVLLSEPAAAWSVAGKITQAIAAPVTAALILISFTPTVQGYYYSFASLLGALQIFLELGLATVITTFVTNGAAALDDRGRVVGDEHALGRLSDLALTSFDGTWLRLILFGVLALGGRSACARGRRWMRTLAATLRRERVLFACDLGVTGLRPSRTSLPLQVR
jgi:hypothetical protein